MLGQHASLLAPPERAGELRDMISRVLAGETVANRETVRRRSDGTEIHVEITLSAIRNAKNEVIGLSAVVRDVTERAHAEAEIERYREHLEDEVAARTARLEAAYHELEMFSYSVSHDLRIPLRAMDGYSRILLDEYQDKLDAEGRRLLGVVRANSQRMARLIDDILDFIRLGRIDTKVHHIDMEALARSALKDLANAMEGRDVNVIVSPLPACHGDAVLLKQVLVNLLGNAVKFTRPRNHAVIEIAGKTEGDEHIFSVKDNGVGFDMRFSAKLFGVFHRLHGVDEFEGNGTGLAIVKRIIVRHGGRVWAVGEVGKGATFYFALPNDEQKVREGASAALANVPRDFANAL